MILMLRCHRIPHSEKRREKKTRGPSTVLSSPSSTAHIVSCLSLPLQLSTSCGFFLTTINKPARSHRKHWPVGAALRYDRSQYSLYMCPKQEDTMTRPPWSPPCKRRPLLLVLLGHPKFNMAMRLLLLVMSGIMVYHNVIVRSWGIGTFPSITR